MKKIVSVLLALLSCCVFAAAASAEAVPGNSAATSASADVTTAVPSHTEPIPTFAGTIRLECESVPTNKPVTVTVVVEDGTLHETETVRWRTYTGTVSDADTDPNVQWKDYSVPFAVDDNMTVEAAVFAGDGTKITGASVEIVCIDKIAPTAPSLASSTSEWTKDPVTVTLSGGEDAQSGLLRLEYRIGAEGAWSEYTGDVSIAAPSAVYARSVDVAGNFSEAVMLDVRNFDLTAPDVSALSVRVSAKGAPVVAESGAFSKYFGSEVTVAVDGAVDTGSGVKKYQYQAVSGTEPAAEDKWLDFDAKNPPVIPGDFCGYVYARAVDAVGNCSAAVGSEGFVVDITPPVVENIKLSETAVTGSRVIVTFNVTDNFWLETVTVNGVYAGVYVSSFTAFRNDDYVIVAVDKVGNRTEQVVQITNINTTPFTLLDTWKSMDPQDFTPATWAAAEAAARELQNLITVEAPQSQIEAAAGRLLTALEGLEPRGDGTLSRELIERIKEYDSEQYTESSWKRVEEGIAALEICLNDPESTQEAVDGSRRALEQCLAELVRLADFTDLDRLIAQCDDIDTGVFSAESKKLFKEALEEARELSRTDSGQTEADAAYRKLLDAMGGLEDEVKKGFNPTPLVFVILGLLIVATASALFIVRMRAKENLAENEDTEEDNSIGDIHFTDEEPSIGDIHFIDDDADQTGGSDTASYIGSSAHSGSDGGAYIGRKNKD